VKNNMTTTIQMNEHIEKTAKEHRQIKITSKRQFTIPKSFFDYLGLADEVVMNAFLLDETIVLKPAKRSETFQDEDYRTIIMNTIEEGYRGKELADEIVSRISRYDNFIAKRLDEFEKDIDASDACKDGIGDEDLNGLEVFFDTKDGTTSKKVGEANT
jgi:bifunctional DNA-binding transcriptional regulator/antitoxin component of YhaV-PrlF toxin-antitoxin module